MRDHRVWMFAFLVLLAIFYHTNEQNLLLKELVSTMKSLRQVETTYCVGVHRVNALCESAVIELMARLGVSPEAAPVLTTAVWKRATHGGVGGGVNDEHDADGTAQGQQGH